MDWLGFLLASIKLVQAVVTWLGNRQQIDAGIAEQIAANLKEATDVIAKAQAARGAQHAADADPQHLRDDDGFRRD